MAAANHPKTNGKIERFFREVERRLPRGRTIDELVEWQNEIKPHVSLDFELSAEAFYHRLPPERILGYAKRW